MRLMHVFLVGLLTIVALLTLAIVRPASSQEVLEGDPVAGLALAREVCAECHAVTAGDMRSPAPGATPFQVIADTPGMTGLAITVWLTTFHPGRSMPAIILSDEERRNIIAHIRSITP